MSVPPGDPSDRGARTAHLEGSLSPPRARFRGKRLLFINPPVVCASNIQIGWYSYAHPTSLLKLAPGTPAYDRHLYALAGKSLEELNWALWPTLDTQDKISWFARLTGDKLEGFSERAN